MIYAGLLWTHTRAAFIALPVGLLVLAALRRSWGSGGARGRLGGGLGRVRRALPHDRARDDVHARRSSRASARTRRSRGRRRTIRSAPDESSTASHLRSLRDGIETVARHPWGYGLGNAGVSASRTGAELKAGESTYTELGVDTGVAGLAAFVAWLVALGLALRRRSPWLAASLASVAVLGLQTDVIGIHWLAVVVFALAGAALRAAPSEPRRRRRWSALARRPKLARRSASASSTRWPSRPT